MGKTSIEWTDASWNPIVGCTEISPGCANCYAAKLAATRLRNHPDYKGLAAIENPGEARWTRELHFLPERLEEPLHWRKPRRIFVCDMGDLFHESVEDEWIERVMTVFLNCPQHTFQVLTKRADRMHRWFAKEWKVAGEWEKPMPNVWLGVSVENQHFADERIPLLLSTPAAVRWISAEPLLGPVDLDSEKLAGLHALGCGEKSHAHVLPMCTGLDWVVCGGESGSGARPMHPDCARSLRDQCQAAGVPFFFKQWGAWRAAVDAYEGITIAGHNKGCCTTGGSPLVLWNLGKHRAGRLLDGREWNEFPCAR